MAEPQWIVRVIENTNPSEKTYGPFPNIKAATDFVSECYQTGRADREKWQTTQVSYLYPLDAEGPYG